MSRLALLAQAGAVEMVGKWAIVIIAIVAICAIVAWLVQKTGFTLAPPVSYIVYAGLAILAIFLVLYLVRGGVPF